MEVDDHGMSVAQRAGCCQGADRRVVCCHVCPFTGGRGGPGCPPWSWAGRRAPPGRTPWSTPTNTCCEIRLACKRKQHTRRSGRNPGRLPGAVRASRTAAARPLAKARRGRDPLARGEIKRKAVMDRRIARSECYQRAVDRDNVQIHAGCWVKLIGAGEYARLWTYPKKPLQAVIRLSPRYPAPTRIQVPLISVSQQSVKEGRSRMHSRPAIQVGNETQSQRWRRLRSPGRLADRGG